MKKHTNFSGRDSLKSRPAHGRMTVYGPLGHLSDTDHAGLWGTQEFHRTMSLVNGGRTRETDLFEGLR